MTARRMTSGTVAVMEVFVDFSRVGQAARFTAPVFRHEREQLAVGARVTVFGDDVAPLDAIVTAVDADTGRVSLELVGPAPSPAAPDTTGGYDAAVPVLHSERTLSPGAVAHLHEIEASGVELNRSLLADAWPPMADDEVLAVYRSESSWPVSIVEQPLGEDDLTTEVVSHATLAAVDDVVDGR